MPTREEALKHLNLTPEAPSEAIEQAYLRLVRRYPPEHNPDRFRLIDESYRLLTSPAYLVESILSARDDRPKNSLGPMLAELPLVAEEAAVAQAMDELRALWLSRCLWPRESAGPERGRPKQGRGR